MDLDVEQTAALETQVADMQALLTKKQRQPLGVDAPGCQYATAPIAGLQVRDSDVGLGEEAAGSKRKSADCEQAGKWSKKGKGKKEQGSSIDECPLHLLEYMIPDDESYMKPSSTVRSGRALPLSPSVANIKANMSGAVVIPSASKMTVSSDMPDTGKKVRRLFNTHDAESAEALNEAAGCTVAEPTPMRRSTRSSRAGGISTTLLT